MSIPSWETSPTIAQIFVVPISSPTTKLSFFPIERSFSAQTSQFNDRPVVKIQINLVQQLFFSLKIRENPLQAGSAGQKILPTHHKRRREIRTENDPSLFRLVLKS